MIVKLVSIQIPKYWDMIKFALNKVERLDSDGTACLFNEVLIDLLNDKCQCFIRVDEQDNSIKALMITRIEKNLVQNSQSIKVICLYAFKINTMEEWQNDFKVLEEFAKSAKCDKVIVESSNRRVLDIISKLGFSNCFTTMSYTLGG